ncbi:hypothetical protein RvVAR031_pl06560 (plasmid) [Agrobacterium vitis]|nr:hypothetical protein RvVAR031_pl06560 [Agrobacterium vitis]
MCQNSDPDLRTLKILQHGDSSIMLLLESPDVPIDFRVIGPGTMAEIQAERIDTGEKQ